MRLRDRVRWDIRRLYHQARKVWLRRRIGDEWEEGAGFRRRRYPDYRTYVEHQKTKFSALRSKSVVGHDRRFHEALVGRLEPLRDDLRGARVLCLGARQGSEVRAFIDTGAFAIGVDLNPGPDNRYVVVGDFHDLQFADGSVDWVYTNSLDHAFDLAPVLDEVRRVLAPGGVFLVEANAGGESGAADAGPYEATVWAGPEALVERIRAAGFELAGRAPFSVPWPGAQLRFRATAAP